MARPVFWPTNDSEVYGPTGQPFANSPVKIYTAQTGGTQVTDLQYVDASGNPTGAVPGGILYSDGNGLLPAFAGPDGGPGTVWGNHGLGSSRLALTAPSGGGAISDAGSDAWLKLHAGGNLDALIVGAVTRDTNGAATSASVVWPDGSAGTYTATTLSSVFPGAVDAYTITYAATSKTITQPTVTRDATTGAVTNRPSMVVS